MNLNRTKLIAVSLVAALHSFAVAAEWWSTGTNQPPSLAPVFGICAAATWTMSGKFTVADDAALHRPVLTASKEGLTLEGKTSYTGDQEVRALVRLRTDITPGPGVSLFLAKGDTNSPAFFINLIGTKAAQRVDCNVYQVVGGKQNVPLNDVAALSEKLDWTSPAQNYFAYHLRAYNQIQPGWPEDFRVRVEHDMASLPDLDHKWLDVRIELRKGRIRYWVDDHLIAEKSDPSIKPEGTTEVRLGPGVQIASYRVSKLGAPVKDFAPIRLAGYANGREFFAGQSVQWSTMPPAGETVNVGGVPFIFPGVNAEGNDHLDIGRSLFRQANHDGYWPVSDAPWIGSSFRDPARIQLRIPNAQYDSLYLIAAADDDRNHVPIVTAMFYRPSAGFSEQFEGTVPLATAKHPSPYPLPQGERESKGTQSQTGKKKQDRPSETTSHISSPLGGEDKGEGYSATSTEAKPLPVLLSNGTRLNLWLVKIPLDPAKLTDFSDLDIVEVELTKQVYQYRSYPDPILYGWHQGGLPSAVHVFAATLGEVPVGFDWQPDKFGHVWQSPDVPTYTATITNHTDTTQTGKLTVVTKSYDGTETNKDEMGVTLSRRAAGKFHLSVPVKLFGYHDITATLEIGGKTWTEKRSFVKLAPDTRAARWTEGKGALFGYWSYHGAHYAPKAEHHIELMTMAGARTTIGLPKGGSNEWIQAHWSRIPAGAWEISPQPWAKEEPYDPAKYEEYKKTVIKLFTDARNAVPEQFRPDHVYFFPEPHLSQRWTEGNYPSYWGEPDWELTKEEKERLRMFFVTAKCAAEAIRSTWPDLKILIPYGDPLFIPPFLRAGFPKNLIDGSGLDMPLFERLPEQQLHQISLHRLYELRKEYEKAGIPNPSLYAIEGTFVPTEVGACSWREQMNFNHRWALLDMAYGVKRFYAGWFAFDCGSYYGAEHYGGCGIQRRIPFCDPKPGYAAFATMTDKLDQADFDGWLKTGSLTTYCLRFRGPKGNVYVLWTLRGKRPVTITLAADAEIGVTDSMNNTKLIKSRDKKTTFTSDPDVIYVTGGDIASVEVGAPDNSDEAPVKDATVIADLGDGSWKYTNERDMIYENNNYDTYRYPGKFTASVVADPTYPSPYPLPQGEKGISSPRRKEGADAGRTSQSHLLTSVATNATGDQKTSSPPAGQMATSISSPLAGEDKGEGSRSVARVLVSKLEKQTKVHELMPWYNTLVPKKPITLRGSPSHLGLWAKGASDWGRVIYCMRDAKGERWISIGTKDQYNCDDVHSWSAFNFDGWRYLRFETPSHLGWDDFRRYGTTWWRNEGGDGVVDLPLTLEKIIVEQRSHILYVNDVQPVASDSVSLGKLYVEYASPGDATDEAVKESRLRMPSPKGLADLPNPIAEMEKTGIGAPTEITKLEPPLEHNDGTQVFVHFKEVPEGKTFYVWCSPHEDGRGAINLTTAGAKNGAHLYWLRPGLKLHFWVTYVDAKGQTSKPSKAASTTLVDTFTEK